MSTDKAKAPRPKPDADKAVSQSDLGQNIALDIKSMFSEFYAKNLADQEANKLQFSEMRSAIAALSNPPTTASPNVLDDLQTPIPDRSKANRRSTIFFGGTTPPYNRQPSDPPSQIQILQNDIVYSKELNVSSLAGLQYLSKQMQLMASQYPNREIKMAHMVSYNLRPHVVAHWNTFCFNQTQITGVEYQEVMVEDWLSFTNDTVQEILIEAARPRTKELYTRELILYLGKDIPQSPDINTDNFSKIFYGPLSRSLNDLYNIYTLLSEETSKFSNNAAKMPVSTYGTKDSPGHIAIWIISLGNQKEAILQWLGKDELIKHKDLTTAFKFIRFRLMEGRTQSEQRQDFDSKLTPVRWNEVRHTQGESHSRHQVSTSVTHKTAHDHLRNRNPTRTHFSALSNIDSSGSNLDNYTYDDDGDDSDDDDDDIAYSSCKDNNTSTKLSLFQQNSPTLNNMSTNNSTQLAIASTFRGYCCELFVLGKCTKPNCSHDHSTAAQERCIQSFVLLSKRELIQHGKLPHWTASQSPASRPECKAGYKTPFPNYSSSTPSLKGPPATPIKYA
jgi:hypothetical protein